MVSSDDRNLMAGEILCKVLIDNDDELMPFAAGSVVGLEEGYALLIKGVDVDGKKVHVALRKDNSDLDEKVIVLDEDMGTYLFRAPIGSGDRNKIVTIAVHFKNAYHATEADMATVDGIWQISDRPLSIRDGLDFDEMAIKRIDAKEGEMAIEMSNDDAIGLRGGKKIKLMGDFYIKTSDQDEVDQSKPLRYYIFREIEIDEGAKEKEDANSEVEVAPASAETSKPYGEEKKTVPGFQGIIALLSLAAVFLAGRRR